MPLDPNLLMNQAIPARQLTYDDRETMLYALSVGAGAYAETRFYFEKDQCVIPSFGQNLAFDDTWMHEAGVDLANVMHGGLDMRFYAPFAPSAEVEVETKIVGVADKGAGKAAIVLTESNVSSDGTCVFTSLSTFFVVGGGGFGGDVGLQPAVVPKPEGAPTESVLVQTRKDQALLFRLLGDRNQLHVLAEPAIALGFDGPILHGACTLGIVCLSVLDRFCENDPARMSRFALRFSGPLYPGETLEIDFWRVPDGVLFAAKSAERGTSVLSAGIVEFSREM